MSEQTAFRLVRYFDVADVEKSVNDAVGFARSYDGPRPQLNPDPSEKLIDVLQKAFNRVKSKYPEAFFSFGINQDPDFWQIAFYTNEPSLLKVLEIIEDLILDDAEGPLLAVVPLSPEDWKE